MYPLCSPPLLASPKPVHNPRNHVSCVAPLPEVERYHHPLTSSPSHLLVEPQQPVVVVVVVAVVVVVGVVVLVVEVVVVVVVAPAGI